VTPIATQQANASGGLFGGMFNANSGATSTDVAANGTPAATSDGSAQDHSSFFANLFKPRNDATAQTPAPQGAVLAGLNPNPQPRRIETPKNEPQQSEPQVAQTPKPKVKSQDANATASSAGGNGLLKGAQPVVPAGTFANRWADTPVASGQ
jgi:hypothetical protein